jgi:uncharacterized protein YjbI with pentapeptide repeats/energy-coupling factor transporter ATP-binding protein EcfA2
LRSRDPSLTVVPDSWPWLAVCIGWLVAGALASFAAWAWGVERSMSFRIGPLVAFSGGLLGPVLVIWLRGVVDRRRASSGGPDLWDPWLDEGGTARPSPGLEPRGILPARALVRPRVLSSDGGSFCLEDEIYPFAKGGERGAIRIDGPTGSGKSTALRHLLATLPAELGVRVLDEPDAATLADHVGPGVVVYAADTPAARKHLATFILAPWGEDERIEYLLGRAGGKCGSVMARLKATDDDSLAEGNPELWRVVLDRMIADDSIAGVRQGLRRELSSLVLDEDLRERVRLHALATLGVPVGSPPSAEEREGWRAVAPTLARLIRHRTVQVLVVADRIADALGDPSAHLPFLVAILPVDLIREAGLLIREAPASVARLAALVEADHRTYTPMAASLLHAADVGWRPQPGSSPRLSHAHLEGVDWPGITLPSAEMIRVDLAGASLWKATLDGVRFDNARLGRARLSGASLRGVSAIEADLNHADLSVVQADGAVFRRANLEAARLGSASLRNCEFQQANLAGARFAKADLTRANFHDATIDDADFSGANLESAVLGRLTLSKANFAGASFAGAELTESNLEGMELPGAHFAGAMLVGAFLTHSTMPRANFRNANLRGAGLAEVSWEGACLAGADLRGASFHMGSSRSGLVNSPIASEGSRTGFYTDDFDEQDFKSPEEIRKADLRGVDLTGANIVSVDFYLVDLRGAILDPSQRLQAQRSGAILHDRRN